MNKKGFTLVELMVVIVIIGILAAVAAPRLSDNINSARCNEVPKNIVKMMDKAVEFEAKGGTWPTRAELIADMGVDPDSDFWEYTVAEASGVFTITATAQAWGGLAGDETVAVTNSGSKTVAGTNKSLLTTKYMKAYLNGASGA